MDGLFIEYLKYLYTWAAARLSISSFFRLLNTVANDDDTLHGNWQQHWMYTNFLSLETSDILPHSEPSVLSPDDAKWGFIKRRHYVIFSQPSERVANLSNFFYSLFHFSASVHVRQQNVCMCRAANHPEKTPLMPYCCRMSLLMLLPNDSHEYE